MNEMKDVGAMSKEQPWVIVTPNGLAYIGLHENESDVWQIYLGWPHQSEVENAKNRGCYAAQATVSWRKP